MKKDKKIDAKLVASYQSGNQEALAKLVKRWHLTFCKQAFWIVKDADISKDIAQDTWQTIIAKIVSLQDLSSFGSWSLRIVYSKSLDHLKKESRAKAKHQDYVKDTIETITDYKEEAHLKLKLSKAIKKLPEQQQIVLKLFYIEEYSLKQISKILSISIGTAKSRLFYAREKLKKQLNNNFSHSRN